MVDREAAAKINQSIVDLQKRCNDLANKASRAGYEERSDIADWLCDEGHEELGLAVLDEKYKEENQ